jgi:hypothetical protein
MAEAGAGRNNFAPLVSRPNPIRVTLASNNDTNVTPVALSWSTSVTKWSAAGQTGPTAAPTPTNRERTQQRRRKRWTVRPFKVDGQDRDPGHVGVARSSRTTTTSVPDPSQLHFCRLLFR